MAASALAALRTSVRGRGWPRDRASRRRAAPTARRMAVGIALAAALGLAPWSTPPAAAQAPGSVPRVGYLTGGALTAPTVEAFRRGLRELGWVDGQNVAIEYRAADGRADRLADLAVELVRLRVDAMVAGGTVAVRAARQATDSVPIVMVGIPDPVALGLVASVARPGGNVTGLAFNVGMETYGKALDLLADTLPKVRRVAVLTNPDNPSVPLALTHVKEAAKRRGLQLRLLEVRGPDGFEGAFQAMAAERVGALFVGSDTMFSVHRARLAEHIARSRLPSMHGFREFVEAGGLMSYGPSLEAVFRRAAFFVARILKGARPGDLPVEQPTMFELVVNLKAARALGVTIPPSIRVRADHVIE